MDELSSTEFRKRFARLTSPTVVTANGHVIGTWTPLTLSYPHEPGSVRVMTFSEADVVRDLDRFNSQPFTGPIPKKGK
jgi:hypothetical protein